MSRFQSWNKRSKKWVLFEGGKIQDMQPEKFAGVEVKKGKPGQIPSNQESPAQESPVQESPVQERPVQESSKPKKKKTSFFW